MMTYNPRDWYWLADDGRLYSSAAQALLDSDEPAYMEWSQEHRPTRWPIDGEGEQTDAALTEVLAPYGLSLWAPGLDEVKAQLRRTIDEAAERERLKYITPGAGQAMTYAEKAAQARQCLAAEDPQPEHYPLLAGEIGITAETLTGVAEVVSAAYGQWLVVGALIEAARLGAKAAVEAATTAEEAKAAAVVPWPSQ
ncbi:hypothetical protein [Shinella pollutisoli]|uniref:DUF4376 domain-containing protein n=1 Tax=Shinella pollutisoli TaxID=2250594 RepID=A0ABV7DJ34_9HYPH|nr:hypothetical protein [Shinella pollutisoli]